VTTLGSSPEKTIDKQGLDWASAAEGEMYAVTPRSWFQRTIIPKPSPAEQCRTSKAAMLALHLWYQSAASRIHIVSVVLWLAVDHVGRRFVVADGADGCPTRPVKARRFGNSARWWMSAIRSTSARLLI